MLGIPLRYLLKHPVTGIADLVADPIEIWTTIREAYAEKREERAKGIRAGPESFQWWNDGDAGLVRAIWCLMRHLRPKNVVETGVAHGVTSRFILEALKRNGDGHLWSIDLPPLDRFWRQIDGHTSRVRVGAVFLDCFMS